jgi:thiol-disulfide isomerase/thioredoxin
VKRLFVLAAAAAILAAQQPPPADPEQQALRDALGEAGTSKIDFLRAIEKHLAKYPQTSQRSDLERAALSSAIEIRDARRIVIYGERVLAHDRNNVEALERVSRYLLVDDNKEAAKKALDYARHLETMIRSQPKPEAGAQGAARATEEISILLSKSFLYQARAQGNLGLLTDAETLARKSYDMFPSAEAAREIARWLERQGKAEEAVAYLAEAFTISDPNVDDSDRQRDRKRMGEWYRKTKNSEAGLGDIVLAAYDRSSTRIERYRAALRTLDPNAGRTDFMDFTVTGIGGDRLHLATLKGKVIVLDFWATWCGPCRAQQPLYEQVKERFKGNANVVFLNINTDQNRAIVKPFLDTQKWNKTVYFEDGLAQLLRVSSIPMTLVVNRRGEIASRMNGYIADRFVDMLSERIGESLKEN